MEIKPFEYQGKFYYSIPQCSGMLNISQSDFYGALRKYEVNHSIKLWRIQCDDQVKFFKAIPENLFVDLKELMEMTLSISRSKSDIQESIYEFLCAKTKKGNTSAPRPLISRIQKIDQVFKRSLSNLISRALV